MLSAAHYENGGVPRLTFSIHGACDIVLSQLRSGEGEPSGQLGSRPPLP